MLYHLHVADSDRPLVPKRPQELPPSNALLGIARCSALEEQLRLRAAHPELRDVASECISTLQAVDLELPARAWLAFPRATGLRLVLGEDSAPGLVTEGVAGRRNITPVAVQRCVQVLLSLPPCVERLQLVDCYADSHTISCLVCWPPEDLATGPPLVQLRQGRDKCLQLAAALRQSPAAPGLKELVVGWEVLASSCMDEALRACPALQTLSLVVMAWPREEEEEEEEGACWQPALPAGLTSLQLHSRMGYKLRLDAAALTGLSRLQHLDLDGVKLVDPPAGAAGQQQPHQLSMGVLASLTTLRSLSLVYIGDHDDDDDNLSLGATELAPLLQLTSLTVNGSIELAVGAWAALAQLPQLAYLESYGAINVPPLAEAAPLAAVTSLKAQLRIPDGYGPGSLCARLPCLQRLRAWDCSYDCYQLAELLRGHPHLQRLQIRDYSGDDVSSWQQPVLASMPRLQHFALDSPVEGADALLADLAACSSLRSIELRRGTPISSISGAGVRALTQASSSATLESIVLDTAIAAEWRDGHRQRIYKEAGRVALADALPLLQARMPRLRELKVPVLKMADEELHAVARQLGRPAEVLRAQLALDVKGAA